MIGEAMGSVLDSAERGLYNARASLIGPFGGRSGAQVAQLVEHAIENRSVGGSIPPLGTTFPPNAQASP